MRLLALAPTLVLFTAAAPLAGCGGPATDRPGPPSPAPPPSSPATQAPASSPAPPRSSPSVQPPETPPAPAPRTLEGALDQPGPLELFTYLLRNARVRPAAGSFCEDRLGELPAADRNLGGLLASYLGHSSNESRAIIEIGCGAPGDDEEFVIPDAPACPPGEGGGTLCRRCALVIQLDGVTEDPAQFQIYGRLLFQYRAGRPLPSRSIFCTEAG